MAEIKFIIPNDKLPRIVTTMKGFYAIPLIDNPEYDSEVEESETNLRQIPEFTDNQWAKESVRRWIINMVKRYETKVLKDAAFAESDDTIIS